VGNGVADVVLHLAQSEEAAAATATHGTLRGALNAMAGDTTDERAAAAVRMERGTPAEVFARWQRARAAALAALRAADPDRPVQWMVGTIKPATLATTRLAEHWAHGLDITGPLGIEFPDTPRLRHIAWLAHRTLPYALSVAGQPPAVVRCELTAPEGAGPEGAGPEGAGPEGAGPDGAGTWRFGSPDAGSAIIGTAGDFCRVAAQRLDPTASGLRASGPDGATALRVLRTYAA
jgi:uncharacterized protein (TIGR03084 family)